MANEKQLIYVNTLVKDLEFLAKHEDSFRQFVILGVVQTVKAHPTVDAVEVVRCKDCKHKGWIQEPCHGKSVDYCHFWDSCINDSEKDFCPYG